MNVIQAFINIIRNIHRLRDQQKTAYKETTILAAIALGHDTPITIETATCIPREQVRKIAQQLIAQNLLVCSLSDEWPHRNHYTFTADGEKTAANLLNYKYQRHE